MLEYAAITPHSPLLSSRISKKQTTPPKTEESFDTIAKVLNEKGIKNLVTIGSHPRYNRSYFSVYISDHYTLTFPEFGDLITSIEVKPWWKGFHRLRESISSPPLEVLSHKEIDYTHGIPLMHLTSRFAGSNQLSVLAINDSQSQSEEEKQEFGKLLRESLDSLNEPYAILCSGDLFVTTEQTNSKAIHHENKVIKLSIENDLTFKETQGLAGIASVKYPTLDNTLPILKGAIGDSTYTINEVSFESINQTSLYYAHLMIGNNAS